MSLPPATLTVTLSLTPFRASVPTLVSFFALDIEFLQFLAAGEKIIPDLRDHAVRSHGCELFAVFESVVADRRDCERVTVLLHAFWNGYGFNRF